MQSPSYLPCHVGNNDTIAIHLYSCSRPLPLLFHQGVEVPIWAVVSLLTAWRVAVTVYVILTRGKGGRSTGEGSAGTMKAAAGEASSCEEMTPVVAAEA